MSAAATITPTLLTAEQVAERLAVSERYVWRLGRDGELPRVEIGKYIRFDPADVDAFIERRKVDAQGGRARVEAPQQRTGSSTPAPTRRRFR